MIKCIIKDDLNLIVFSLAGTVTRNDVIEKVRFLKARGKINQGMNTAIDTREQINIFTRDEILKIFFEMVGIDKMPLISKTAIIAVSNSEFGTGKLYSAYKNKVKVEAVVFSNIDNVSEWLGIPKGEIVF
jgi:hypothetical protein